LYIYDFHRVEPLGCKKMFTDITTENDLPHPFIRVHEETANSPRQNCSPPSASMQVHTSELGE
jgi:hypothetical protein